MEVLYGMKRQPQGSTKQEITATDSIKFESRETNNKFTSDAKSRVSSPISNSPCVVPQLMSPFPHNSCSFVTSMSAAGGYYKLTELSVLFISFRVPQMLCLVAEGLRKEIELVFWLANRARFFVFLWCDENLVSWLESAAPKRKRPRPVKYEDENPSIFAV